MSTAAREVFAKIMEEYHLFIEAEERQPARLYLPRTLERRMRDDADELFLGEDGSALTMTADDATWREFLGAFLTRKLRMVSIAVDIVFDAEDLHLE